jgi:hypothetical protein
LCWATPSIRTDYNWKLGNGNKVLFWMDKWVSRCSLATLFSDLFSICNEPMATVDQVLVHVQVHLSFCRCFSAHMMGRWGELCSLLLSISLSAEMDNLVWVFETSGVYSVRSFYRIISDMGISVPHLATIWKIRFPAVCMFSSSLCARIDFSLEIILQRAGMFMISLVCSVMFRNRVYICFSTVWLRNRLGR